MSVRSFCGVGAAVLTGALLMLPHRAAALSMKECGANYEAAKKAGTLNGQDWKAYRAANCGASTAATPAAAAAPAAAPAVVPAPAATAAPSPVRPSAAAAPVVPPPGATVARAPASPPPNAGSPVFPRAIDPKYASLKGGKARMKTCDEQYQANKATGGNAGLKWIEKGGGYYSECSKHLKGA